MSKLKYTEFEKQMNSVLKHQDKTLADIHFPSLYYFSSKNAINVLYCKW